MASEQSPITGKKRKLLLAIWVLALAGLAVSIELTRIHYAVYRSPDYVPACRISEKIDCESVALSKYSSIILGVPNSVFGIAFYSLFILLIPFRRGTQIRMFAHLENYLALLSICSIGYTIFLASISTFVLKTLCPWCTALYLINTLSLIFILLALDRPGQVILQFTEDFHRVRTDPRYLGGLLGVVILFMVLVIVQLNRYYNKAPWPIPLPGGKQAEVDINKDPVVGPEHAPVTIIEFSDFQCPYCREMHGVLKEMRQRFGPRLRIVYKNFPLDNQCNPALRTPVHPNSCMLAVAAECAYQSGCFENFYDKLIQAEVYTESSLTQMAMDCGIDPNQFRSCMGSEPPRKAVQRDIADALKVGISATPTLIVNGYIIQGTRSGKEMGDIIGALLEGKKPYVK
jgi:protein-disulfide isomerase/uncharacterized membrane protein